MTPLLNLSCWLPSPLLFLSVYRRTSTGSFFLSFNVWLRCPRRSTICCCFDQVYMNLIHPILISAQYRFQSVSVFNLNYYYHYATSIITISLQVCSPFDFISFGLLNAARKLPYFPISYVDVSASVSSISLYDLRVLDEYNIFSIFMLNVICYFFPFLACFICYKTVPTYTVRLLRCITILL